jgi:hypothetical protein
MDRLSRRRKTAKLWALILVAAGYGLLPYYVPSLTGSYTLDGAISVLLGLYICSHPAANAIDMLFFERVALRTMWSEWSGIGWLALNLVTLLAGWLVMLAGTTHLVGPTRIA